MNAIVTYKEAGLSRQEVMAAQLPGNYTAMIIAMKQCDSTDECLEWVGKAAAISAYFRMARDKEPIYIAARIRWRAIRRLGELINREYANPNRSGNVKDLRTRVMGSTVQGDHDFAIFAQKLARVKDGLFDSIVEREDPPLYDHQFLDKKDTVDSNGEICREMKPPMTGSSMRQERVSITGTYLRRIFNKYDHFSLSALPLSKLEASQLLDIFPKIEEWMAMVEAAAKKTLPEPNHE